MRRLLKKKKSNLRKKKQKMDGGYLFGNIREFPEIETEEQQTKISNGVKTTTTTLKEGKEKNKILKNLYNRKEKKNEESLYKIKELTKKKKKNE